MTVPRSRRLRQKGKRVRSAQAQVVKAQAVAARKAVKKPAPPAAPVILEWCAEHHDKNAPEDAPPRFPALSFITERPYKTTFVLIHVFFFGALLASGKTQAWFANNSGAAVAWFMVAGMIGLGMICGQSLGNVTFYQIDLEGERIVLHLPGSGDRIRIMRLSFDAITSVCPFQYSSYNNPCGIDISYLDDRLKLRKVRVPNLVPEALVDAQMDALRPALGFKIEETVCHDT
ncbi:hypothetical protein [Massilia rubra]|uniref:Uncharacterized protein n=1 Tax=Massilia rubra TaxID=2607910 RepID=A0ABX0LQX0_9BURK|nr:hypothetical protein [Massilia rubra]NHZ36890.1 hypothetical protein [Massilia rubra]